MIITSTNSVRREKRGILAVTMNKPMAKGQYNLNGKKHRDCCQRPQDNVPFSGKIEGANRRNNADDHYKVDECHTNRFYPTDGPFSRRDFRRRMSQSTASVPAIDKGAAHANRQANSLTLTGCDSAG